MLLWRERRLEECNACPGCTTVANLSSIFTYTQQMQSNLAYTNKEEDVLEEAERTLDQHRRLQGNSFMKERSPEDETLSQTFPPLIPYRMSI